MRMKRKTGTEPLKNAFRKWLDGDTDVFSELPEAARIHDISREEAKEDRKRVDRMIDASASAGAVVRAERKGFRTFYNIVAVISCAALIAMLLFLVGNLPRYGEENERTVEVVTRYVEKGLEETGAVNIVAGMILDYRAFDTLGESHVLFTALICVMILLRQDRRNMTSKVDSYASLRNDEYFDPSGDIIMRSVGMLLGSCIFLYGFYILMNGQNSPGGGFSGGAVMGSGLIIFSAAFGMKSVDRYFSFKLFSGLTFTALAFYSFAKGYVFFTGANGLENHIPKGEPGALLSGGLILPLDIAVGLVVACTMFGFYSLFRRGNIGSDTNLTDQL